MFAEDISTPVVLPSRRNVEFTPNSNLTGLGQNDAQVALTVGASLLGAIVGFAIQYVICCQASKRCR